MGIDAFNRSDMQRTILRSLLAINIVSLIAGCGDASPPPPPPEALTTTENRFDATKKQADSGDAQAQWKLGEAYLKGDGVALDKEIEFEEVNKLFALAALIISKSRFCFSLSTLPVSAIN